MEKYVKENNTLTLRCTHSTRPPFKVGEEYKVVRSSYLIDGFVLAQELVVDGRNYKNCQISLDEDRGHARWKFEIVK